MIECSFGLQQFHDLNSNQYYCDAELVSSDNMTHLIEPISGQHKSGKTNKDVTVFLYEANKSKLERLPFGIGETFPNLKYFWWHGGALTSISAEDLEAFPNLQIASFGSNKITSLKSDLFVHTPNISFVWFKSNKIRFVGSNLLDGLEKLREVNFLDNKCIDFQAKTPEDIAELKSELAEQCSFVDIPEPRTWPKPLTNPAIQDSDEWIFFNYEIEPGIVRKLLTKQDREGKTYNLMVGMEKQAKRLKYLNKRAATTGFDVCFCSFSFFHGGIIRTWN